MMQKTYPMVKAIALKFANTIIILQTVETAKKKMEGNKYSLVKSTMCNIALDTFRAQVLSPLPSKKH